MVTPPFSHLIARPNVAKYQNGPTPGDQNGLMEVPKQSPRSDRFGTSGQTETVHPLQRLLQRLNNDFQKSSL